MGALMLLTGGAAALILVNSPWAAAYDTVQRYEIGFFLGGNEIRSSFHEWVNEFLVTLFFFRVGLEESWKS